MSRNFRYALLGHFLLSVAAFFMVSQTANLFPAHKISTIYKLALACSTFSVYRLAYYGIKWPYRFSRFFGIREMLISLLLLLFLLPFLEFRETAGLLLMALFCLSYFMEVGTWKGLRTIPVIKSIWVALGWTVTTAVIPLFHVADFSVLLFFAERFLFMLALSIIYNLRDMTSDTKLGISTIPHKIGVGRTKQLTILILGINAFLIYIHHYSLLISVALNTTLFITTIIVLLAKEGGHQLYYSLAVDATMILQSVLVIYAAMYI